MRQDTNLQVRRTATKSCVFNYQ